jgi:hypothetical protein
MECKVEIEKNGTEITLTYHVRQQERFYINLASGKCEKCYYFTIKAGLDECEIEVRYVKEGIIRLTPTCKDNSGRMYYPDSIQLEIKREKFK